MEEEADARRIGLTDEQKAIFYILRHGKQLTEKEKDQIKLISFDCVELWYGNSSNGV